MYNNLVLNSINAANGSGGWRGLDMKEIGGIEVYRSPASDHGYGDKNLETNSCHVGVDKLRIQTSGHYKSAKYKDENFLIRFFMGTENRKSEINLLITKIGWINLFQELLKSDQANTILGYVGLAAKKQIEKNNECLNSVAYTLIEILDGLSDTCLPKLQSDEYEYERSVKVDYEKDKNGNKVSMEIGYLSLHNIYFDTGFSRYLKTTGKELVTYPKKSPTEKLYEFAKGNYEVNDAFYELNAEVQNFVLMDIALCQVVFTEKYVNDVRYG